MASTTTTATRQLPTPQDLRASYDAVGEGFDRLERIGWALSSVDEALEKHEPYDATLDDATIGGLYRYLNDVDAAIAQQVALAASIRRTVDSLHLYGRDAEARAAKEASVDA